MTNCAVASAHRPSDDILIFQSPPDTAPQRAFSYSGADNNPINTMPNWCFNQLTAQHPDPAMLEKLADALRSGRLFATFLP